VTASPPRPVTPVRAIKVRPGRRVELPDDVATEEPMQILVAGPGQRPDPLAVTMRTPGHDFELAAGFVVTEGVTRPDGIVAVDYCEAAARDPAARYNHVTVWIDHRWEPQGEARRFAASASCGTCGKTTIDQVTTGCGPVAVSEAFPASVVPVLPDRLRRAQKAFDRTGGLHAAGLFGPDGELRAAREDVGRHNAVDKVLGWMILGAGRGAPDPATPMALAVSGRVSFEIVQKVAVAGIGMIAAVSAPSSLAVTAAGELGVTLAAFVRGGTFNVYTHPERVAFDR
jgi:FdhD protein